MVGMGPVLLLARLQVKQRFRGLVLVAVVVGLIGGISASLIAGSRRSSTVVDRYFRAGVHYDLSLFAPSIAPDQVAALPGVRRVYRHAYIAMLARQDGQPKGINAVAEDPTAIDKMTQLLAGRLPAAGDTFGAVVNESFVGEHHVRVGDDIDAQMFADADADNINAGIYVATGPHYRFHITGIVRTPDDIALDESRSPKGSEYASTNSMFVSFAFYLAHRHEFIDFGAAYEVQLVRPSDRAALVAAVQAAGKKTDPPPVFGPPSFTQRRSSIATPVSVESSLLLGLGIAVAIAGVVAVALLLRAEERSRSPDGEALHALGYTRVQLGAVAAARAAPFALLGAVAGLGVAVASSARYPVGIGREIELRRGAQVNVAVLGGLVPAALLVVVGGAFVFGRLADSGRRLRRPALRPSLSAWLARRGAPVEAVVGTQFAFERDDGSRSVSSRQAVAGGAIALAVIAALVIFVSGIGDLYGQPTAHGWPWDLVIGNTNFSLSTQAVQRIAADHRIAAYTVAKYGQASVDGKALGVLAIDPKGTAPPRVLTGRLPGSAHEIALGAKIARSLHVGIGARVTLSIADGEYTANGPTHDVETTVVGIELPPVLGDTDLGDDGVVTLDAIAAAGGAPGAKFVLTRLAAGGVRSEDAIAHDYSQEMLSDVVPARVVNLHRVRWLLLLAMALAGALGAVVLAYTVGVGARLRARQLAVLRALGMSRRRVGRVLACQGVALAAAMCLIGLPLGAVAGSLVWRSVAHQLGVGDHPALSFTIALLVPVAIAVGLFASLLPGRRLRRGNVTASLHAE
jgi:putative ABC transport system permease protein